MEKGQCTCTYSIVRTRGTEYVDAYCAHTQAYFTKWWSKICTNNLTFRTPNTEYIFYFLKSAWTNPSTKFHNNKKKKREERTLCAHRFNAQGNVPNSMGKLCQMVQRKMRRTERDERKEQQNTCQSKYEKSIKTYCSLLHCVLFVHCSLPFLGHREPTNMQFWPASNQQQIH